MNTVRDVHLSNRFCTTTRFWPILLILLPSLLSHVQADVPKQHSAFTPQLLSAKQQDEVLLRAKFLRHAEDGRPQLNADTLRVMGAVPAFSLEFDDAMFYLTYPFAFHGGRQIAMAFVRVDDDVHARVLYRSNSQFTWRLCDATNAGHIGKGFHEFDKQLPIPVTAALLKLYNRVASLRSATNDDGKPSQPALAQFLLRGLTEDARSGEHSGRVIRTPERKYWSREYAAYIPSEPVHFSKVGGWLKTAGNLRVADFKQVTLPPDEKLPDVKQVVHAFQFRSPAFAKLDEGNGELSGKVFLSRDRTVRYLFFEDSHGRAVLSGVELLLVDINLFGLRSRYLNVAGMDAPLFEYYLQIPEQFGGAERPGYRLNWSFVREQPIIRHYYERQNRTVPPDLQQ